MASIQTQLHQQALDALKINDIKQAHALLVKLITLQPNHADGYFLMAMVNVKVGQINKAISLIEKALTLHHSIEYNAYLAKCLALKGEYRRVKEIALAIDVNQIDSGLVADTIGVSLSHIGLYEQAMLFFEKAVQLNNNNGTFFYNLGVCAKFLGLFTQAETAFERAIKLEPIHHQAHFALADLLKVTEQNNHTARLHHAFEQVSHPDAKLHLGHALAKEYQDMGQYDAAFFALQNAKAAKLKQHPFDMTRATQLFAHIQQCSEQHRNTEYQGATTSEPIFVLGMPRSGTTLVERILSSHSDVSSAGELQDFGLTIKRMTGTKSPSVLDTETITAAYQLDMAQVGQQYLSETRVVTGHSAHFVDKLPFNFYYVDLIRKSLPNAKIICLLRDPMDTCIGNYRQLFTINNPYYAYSLDLLDTGRFYQQFYQLMLHWQTLHQDAIKLVHYEQLVAHPEEQIRALLDYCELPWQDACVDFHLNQAPVSTASKVQVREPLNNKAIGRWRKFSEHTQSLERYFTAHNIPYLD
ncbi:tetratricopeptide repeat-containing sulfotransferase family protein [Pseudoalteromonas ulvae]|uniref:Sulfotransferase family protein n=1 Tax=Pseudoalteromonas ulvae TaxID=107327 RepID=A0A244CT09_PSEDV|nr:sulfotransferase [Pseudoalteromonas ulvae]OUL58733.1 sulfotransferase family protein [Pseudoalteromonas ulvae]